MPIGKCHVCQYEKAEIERGSFGTDSLLVICARCGTYQISATAWGTVHNLEDELYRLGGVLRNASEYGRQLSVTTYNIDELVARAPLSFSISSLFDSVMLKVADRTMASKTLRETITLERDDYPLFYLRSGEDFFYLVSKLHELQLLEVRASSGASLPVRLTVSGWQRIEKLQAARGKPAQAFVAMWFDESLDEAYSKGIDPALRATGYDPLRIDRLAHNERIDDKILAEIRRSGLVVADFTGQRPGVYFEAGFGLGLGVPVIWTCRKDSLEGAHFDTRQYNHLVWTEPLDLREQLEARIRALGFARSDTGSDKPS